MIVKTYRYMMNVWIIPAMSMYVWNKINIISNSLLIVFLNLYIFCLTVQFLILFIFASVGLLNFKTSSKHVPHYLYVGENQISYFWSDIFCILKILHENFWSPWHTIYRYVIYLNLNNIELIWKTFVSFTFSLNRK